MVTYDFICRAEGCGRHGIRCEGLLRSWESQDPSCPECGNSMERQFPAPRSVWLKPWGAYGVRAEDRQQPGFTEEGIHVVRRRSARPVGGEEGVERDFLRTRKEVRDYCRAEGLTMPDEVNPNARVDRSGKNIETAGMPGQWV